MKRDDSQYRSFSDLPDFIRKHNISPGKFEIDEENVFFEAMKGVRKISTDRKRISGRTRRDYRGFSAEKEEKRRLEETLRDDHVFSVTNLPEYMEGYAEDMNPLIMDKLKDGEFSIERVLDLHGYSSSASRILFERFIRDAVKSGLQCVKVIHGRGLKSKNDPVLKEKVKLWIIKAMHRKWILAFSSSPMRGGGPGATNILLRRRPVKRHIRIVG